ncbi:uncharacterized protein LOC133533270 [Cydia pomonella]|uniref:uncharacterized protein LOC133533270 n=1 Tax=Cydia pomonella TaxID=82600 RepID=UPI002ADDF286|nr:uncharacterized protein LOC133533270 [Cydia pomonella]
MSGRCNKSAARPPVSTAATMASDGRTKRSQSICAPASASMEALVAPMETTPAPRRRPAARSQSARITGGRSVRHRRQQQQQQLDRETRARYSSEPRLAEAETPPQVRRQASARRRPPPGHNSQPRRSNAFLDVPKPHQPEQEEPDEDSYRLRTFNITQKGGKIGKCKRACCRYSGEMGLSSFLSLGVCIVLCTKTPNEKL